LKKVARNSPDCVCYSYSFESEREKKAKSKEREQRDCLRHLENEVEMMETSSTDVRERSEDFLTVEEEKSAEKF